MRSFVGRTRELESLQAILSRVREQLGGAKPGRLIMMRGRRRVGKSTLLEQFIDRSNCPSLFFTASRQAGREPALFADELAASSLRGSGVAADQQPRDWDAALRLLAAALPGDEVSFVVVDEFPYLLESDPSLEAVFQKGWDRHLQTKPVVFVLVGSDLAMMERLNDADRALHQRGTEMVVHALNPRETGQIVGAPTAADAFDAHLITGGLPLICDEWSPASTMWDFLDRALTEPTSALIVSAERSLRAEFPTEAQAGIILGQIGSGAVTFTTITRAGGGLTQAAVGRGVELLQAKRLIARDLPLSTRRSREARYRVTDPYLQFWLRFIGPYLPEIERGRGDRVTDRIRHNWTAWRGRAVEPVIHQALARLLPLDGVPDAGAVGGYWTRSNTPEVDIVGADQGPVATSVAFTGTIKWPDTALLDRRDVAQLIADTPKIPGANESTPRIAVSRNGSEAGLDVAAVLGPDDLIQAWPSPRH
jgi:AAA+ ATPase superfamily predicted ATPase